MMTHWSGGRDLQTRVQILAAPPVQPRISGDSKPLSSASTSCFITSLIAELRSAIGETGIYINPNQLQKAVSNWADNTPNDVKIKQMKQAAMMGLILSASVLILSIIFERH